MLWNFLGTFFSSRILEFILGFFCAAFLYQVCERELLLLHCGVCLLQEIKFLSISSIWVLKFCSIEPIGRFPPSQKKKGKKKRGKTECTRLWCFACGFGSERENCEF